MANFTQKGVAWERLAEVRSEGQEVRDHQQLDNTQEERRVRKEQGRWDCSCWHRGFNKTLTLNCIIIKDIDEGLCEIHGAVFSWHAQICRKPTNVKRSMPINKSNLVTSVSNSYWYYVPCLCEIQGMPNIPGFLPAMTKICIRTL